MTAAWPDVLSPADLEGRWAESWAWAAAFPWGWRAARFLAGNRARAAASRWVHARWFAGRGQA